MVLCVQRVINLCLLFGVACLFVGCGPSGPEVVPVKGVVTYKGKPIEKISVVFHPEGKGMMATGLTDAKGEFSLQTSTPGDGAMMGDYKVTFIYDSGVVPDMFNPKKEVSPIPEKYGNAARSGKTATVKASASDNVFQFDLE
jgi:hypothetical protein